MASLPTRVEKCRITECSDRAEEPLPVLRIGGPFGRRDEPVEKRLVAVAPRDAQGERRHVGCDRRDLAVMDIDAAVFDLSVGDGEDGSAAYYNVILCGRRFASRSRSIRGYKGSCGRA